MQLEKLMNHALEYPRLLNLVMPQVIPFNRPLGLKIRELTTSHAEVEMPFKRANKNHLGGLHACALATIGEFTAGILILRRMDPTRQRLVLKRLEVEYMKQGRGKATAKAEWPEGSSMSVEEFRSSEQAEEISMSTVVSRADGEALASVRTVWQVKPWSQVRKNKS
jgi:acyl-coenzyme A thioesterase PaaI-like protein